jgi:hypothetical protein
MSGRSRLPSGGPRKASQRHSWRAVPVAIVVEPSWQPGAKVIWQGYTGQYLDNAAASQAQILIGTRAYLVRRADLQPA